MPALATFAAAELAIAGRMLATAATDIATALEGGDLDRARAQLGLVVSMVDTVGDR